MNIYFAPMEGITGYIYRNAHNSYFRSIDKYFSPFIAGKHNQNLKTKEMNDILPENNKDLMLIPQILTNQAKDFIQTSRLIKQLGYHEINLNLGCPSKTVVSKNMGSGFLSKIEELDAFLDEIFSASITKISVKTRIGKEQPEEFYELIELFNKYPMEELIIHPRLQKDFYKNKPNRKAFQDAIKLSKNHVCYNGDLFTAKDYIEFISEFSSTDTIMIGRGLLANPGLIGSIQLNNKLDKGLLKEFHDRILNDYRKILFGDRNVLFKMKEIWFYMIRIFSNHEKYYKKIKKSERVCDYEREVTNLFLEQEIMNEQNIFF